MAGGSDRVQGLLQVEQAQIHAGRVKALFVTHLHGDHCFGIPGLLRSVSTAREGTPLAEETFRIFGPPGLRPLVTSALAFDATPLCMPLVSLCPPSPTTTCCWAARVTAVLLFGATRACSWPGQRMSSLIPGQLVYYPCCCASTWLCTHLVLSHGTLCAHTSRCMRPVQSLLRCCAPWNMQTPPCCRRSQSGPYSQRLRILFSLPLRSPQQWARCSSAGQALTWAQEWRSSSRMRPSRTDTSGGGVFSCRSMM